MGGAASVPTGRVIFCFGGCPAGECDNDLFFADVRCSSVPVGSNSTFCAPGVDSSYCLRLDNRANGPLWTVTCVNGTPTHMLCAGGGCGIVGAGEPAMCI
jgi:hypothetical protein